MINLKNKEFIDAIISFERVEEISNIIILGEKWGIRNIIIEDMEDDYEDSTC